MYETEKVEESGVYVTKMVIRSIDMFASQIS